MWVLQKATEIGVWGIVLLITVRTELRLNPEKEETRMKRRKILLEAVKQCGRPQIPKLATPLKLEAFFDGASADLMKRGRSPSKSSFKKIGRPLLVWLWWVPKVVGTKPIDCFFRHKKVPSVSLGTRILRTERAPVTVLSILQYELGDLSP